MAGSMSTEPSTASSASMLWGGVWRSVIAHAYEFCDFLVALECLRPQLDDLLWSWRLALSSTKIIRPPPPGKFFTVPGPRRIASQPVSERFEISVQIDVESNFQFFYNEGGFLCRRVRRPPP